MSKKQDVLITVADKTERVTAYTTDTEGLVVHREVRYSQRKNEHRTTSKWTVTHLASGMTLLVPNRMFETKMEAQEFARLLGKEDVGVDWTDDIHEWDTEAKGLLFEKVTSIAEKVNVNTFRDTANASGVSLPDLAPVLDADDEGKYGMRTEGRGRDRTFVIFNKEDDSVVERLSLPGRATERLVEMNEEAAEKGGE